MLTAGCRLLFTESYESRRISASERISRAVAFNARILCKRFIKGYKIIGLEMTYDICKALAHGCSKLTRGIVAKEGGRSEYE